MSIAKRRIRPTIMAKMGGAIGSIGAHIIKFFEQGMVGRCGSLKRIDLGRVGKTNDVGRPLNRTDGGETGSREMKIHSIAIRSAVGFEFECRTSIAQGRADLDAATLKIGIESALGGVKKPLPLRASLQPPKPKEVTVIRRNAAIAKGAAIVVLPKHFSSQRQLMQIAHTLHAAPGLFALAEGRKHHCGQEADDRDDEEQFEQRKSCESQIEHGNASRFLNKTRMRGRAADPRGTDLWATKAAVRLTKFGAIDDIQEN